MADLSDLSDQELVWLIPFDLGLEVASRWRVLNDEVQGWRKRTSEAEAERDRLSEVAETLAAALSSHCGVPAEVLIKAHSPNFTLTPPSSSPSSGP
jgi:hypothetical protein